MIQDMGLTKADLLQLTASFEANMMALRNRTIKEGKFAWQLMTNERVGDSPSSCRASLEKYCKPDAPPQSEAMYYAATKPAGEQTDYKAVEHTDVTRLMDVLTAGGYEVIKTENLYLFDGERGFSLGQGE